MSSDKGYEPYHVIGYITSHVLTSLQLPLFQNASFDKRVDEYSCMGCKYMELVKKTSKTLPGNDGGKTEKSIDEKPINSMR